MHLTNEGPKWYILLRVNDSSAYLNHLKEGYDSAELALTAWETYYN